MRPADGAVDAFGPVERWLDRDSVVGWLAPHCQGALAVLAGMAGWAGAAALLDRIVASQWDAPGQPWHGSFGGRPTGPIAWVDGWDPNLRSLVGLVLGAASETFGPKEAWTDALVLVVEAEEAAGRLPSSYGNIAAAHAASALGAARLTGRADLADIGGAWLERIEDDVAARGGWCEHASPTYAGVCVAALAAAARWAADVDTGAHERAERLGRQAAAELVGAWNSSVGDLIGPFGRAYHLPLTAHVAVSGLALAGGGVTAAAPSAGARHPEDWGWAAVLEAVDAASLFDPAPPSAGSAWSPSARTVEGFGAITQAARGHIVWGAVAGQAADWHHQTITASIHSPGTTGWLWHPSVSVTATTDGFEVSVREPGDGAPAWLWGSLSRPTRPLVEPPDHLAWHFSQYPHVAGRAAHLPGGLTLRFEHEPEPHGLVVDGRGPAGYELRLPLVPQSVEIIVGD